MRVARRSFVERNPEIIKRYWKASIRGHHFIHIAPENYPFLQFVEAKLRLANPDESKRMRDLWSIELMQGAFFPMDGQVSVEGIWRILEEHQDADVLAKSITRGYREFGATRFGARSWTEISQMTKSSTTSTDCKR